MVNKTAGFLGEIPTLNDFEQRHGFGSAEDPVDLVLDDTALVYRGSEGLFVITGCSHSGICNIIEYAKKVCGEAKVQGVIGGWHLFKVDDVWKKRLPIYRSIISGSCIRATAVPFKRKRQYMHRYLLKKLVLVRLLR